jgi:hypothetical protein
MFFIEAGECVHGGISPHSPAERQGQRGLGDGRGREVANPVWTFFVVGTIL